jgi:hypothetical protein
MNFLSKLNNLLNKKDSLDKEVYTDIENFIVYKNRLSNNYESVIFGLKYKNKYDEIVYFNHGVYLYDSPLYPIYRVSYYDVLFNIDNNEYIFYVGGGNPTIEKIIDININFITKKWSEMEEYIILFSDKIIVEEKEAENELINQLKKYVKENNIEKDKLIEMIY